MKCIPGCSLVRYWRDFFGAENFYHMYLYIQGTLTEREGSIQLQVDLLVQMVYFKMSILLFSA
jgi:hypothetical protein